MNFKNYEAYDYGVYLESLIAPYHSHVKCPKKSGPIRMRTENFKTCEILEYLMTLGNCLDTIEVVLMPCQLLHMF